MQLDCTTVLPALFSRVAFPAPDAGLRPASSLLAQVMLVFAPTTVQPDAFVAKSPFVTRFGAASASRPDSSIAAIAIRKRALPATSAADLRMEFLGGLAGMRGCVLVARAA
jgi:hypothetical protein